MSVADVFSAWMADLVLESPAGKRQNPTMQFFRKSLCFLSAGAFLFSGMLSALAADYYVSQHRAKVVPNKIYSFAMPEAGTLDGFLAGRTHAKKGELIGRINRARTDSEALAVELRIGAERLAKKKEILALVRQKEEMEFLQTLSVEERALIGKRELQADARAVALLAEQIELAEREMAASEKQAREEFARKRELYDLAMPFDGRVQYHFSLPENVGEALRLAAGAPIATVADDSACFVAVNVVHPDLIRLPVKALSVKLSLGGNEALEATYSHKRIEKNGNAEALVYFFRVPEASRERAHELLGGNCVARLFFNSKAELKVLKKADLVRGDAETPFASWEALIAAKFPQHAIVFIGETSIGLREREPAKSQK